MLDAVAVCAETLKVFQLGAVAFSHVRDLSSRMMHFDARIAMLAVGRDRVQTALFAEELSVLLYEPNVSDRTAPPRQDVRGARRCRPMASTRRCEMRASG
jgi:hypothetical protein